MRSIEMAWTIFGEHAFRRFYPGHSEDRNGAWLPKLNIALWDTVLYGLSLYQKRD